MEYIGFINDDNNEVGKVHIGVVFKITVSTNDVEAKETDTLRIKWVEKGNIESYDDFETWKCINPSRFIIKRGDIYVRYYSVS